MSRRLPLTVAFVAVLTSVLLSACNSQKKLAPQQQRAAADPSLVGRWCYKPGTLPKIWQVLEIHRVGSRYQLLQLANDGSRRTVDLVQSGNSFGEVGSDTGDRYEIDAEGFLGVLDNEGLIGTAEKLSNVPQPNDCQS